jgi:hypothetical protein
VRRGLGPDQCLEHRALLVGDHKRSSRRADNPSYGNPHLFTRHSTSEPSGTRFRVRASAR